ncbi:MAG: MYG1 family protein [Candidatus Pacebacteria bacterium]|nr:MYG1 family protein [Candidatus Paceibacterota bacterium]MDD5356562.1 MYG1 family protein [Candidatus Paceibacterota bacterium]
MIFKKKIKAVTHNGYFHADDVFSAALLLIVLGENISFTRTRNEKEIQDADYTFDVGGVYNPSKHRYDHHQTGGAGKRENGIPYAAFGLFWKQYGEKMCGSIGVAEKIEKKLVMPIDANDVGVDIVKSIYPEISSYTVNDIVSSFRPSWKEDDDTMDACFMEAVRWAKTILSREIKKAKDAEEAQQFVEKAYEEASDKRLIILSRKYPWGDTLRKHPEPLFVVQENTIDNTWRAYAVSKDKNTFENRKNFPASWAGKKDAELASITGVPDARFCHNGLFLAVAKSKEGALKLADIALKS